MTGQPTLPLSGLRVVDCSRLLPCSYGTQLLADLGAEVVKVEQAGGEIGRAHDRFPTVNRHKLSVVLDLGCEEDRSRLHRLVADSEVLVESFRPGVMERFGLGYEAMHERFPSLVYVSSSGYAEDSPTARRPGHDLNYLAAAGALQPRLIDTPAQSPIPVGDLFTGLVVALGTLAALAHARNTGQGQHVSTNMADVALSIAAVGAGRLPAPDGESPPPLEGENAVGLRTWPDVPLGNFPCYGTYQTSDGRFVAFGNIETKFWREFLEVMDLTALVDAQFAIGADAEAARAVIADAVGSHTLAHWESVFADTDVCFAPVRTLREAVSTADVRTRGLVEVAAADLLIAAFPATFSETPPRRGGTSPRPGEHNHLADKDGVQS